MAVARPSRWLLGVLLVVGLAACSGDEPGAEGPAVTTAPATTTTTPDDVPLAADELWVLGDPDLTFVRIEPDKAVPLGAHVDDEAPLVPGTRLLVSYRTPTGGAVYLEQGELADPEAATPQSLAVTERGPGEAPVLTTFLGGRRIVISAAPEQLRPLAETLQAVPRNALDALVDEVSVRTIEEGTAEPWVDGVTIHRPTDGDALACIDGEEPDGCAIVATPGPMILATIPDDGAFLVVGCIHRQPVPVTEVLVDDRSRPLGTAPCGLTFSAPDVPAGTLTVTFDDGPGGVGTYTFDLP
jgi:hypothetical protein